MSDASGASKISEVEPRALASFTRQLGAMLHAGVDVLRALRIASNHSGDTRLLEASVEISRLLQDGRELHVALARHPELFGPFYVEMARQGEQDGTLGQVLLSVAEYLEGLADAQASAAAMPSESSVSTVASVSAAVSLAPAAGAALLGAGVAVLLHAIGLISAAAAAALALLWSGAVLLYVSSQQRAIPTPASPRPAPVPPAVPSKSPARREAETEGIVRAALLEQEEEEEQHPPDPASAFRDPFGDAEPLLSDELSRKPR